MLATVFGLLFDRAEPIQPALLANVSGITPEMLAGMLDKLSQAGRIRLDDIGRVIGSGVSASPPTVT